MKIRLGYVAVPLTIPDTSSTPLTMTNYRKLGMTKGNEKLDEVICSNFVALKNILKYNIKNEIYFYRMTSALIPLGTHPDVSFEIFHRYQSAFEEIGKYIKQNQMRVDLHPDQFCVLNSMRQEVIETTIRILEFYQNMFQTMKIDGIMILHVGSSQPSKKEAMDRFIEVFRTLNPSLQKMIVLENDDKSFSASDVLFLCETLNIPMVLDYHHNECLKSLPFDDLFPRFLNTWRNRQIPPKLHFSSPKNEKEYRSHHQFIDAETFFKFLEQVKPYQEDLDIMLEAKAKDIALFRLIRQIKSEKDLIFQKNTVFFL